MNKSQLALAGLAVAAVLAVGTIALLQQSSTTSTGPSPSVPSSAKRTELTFAGAPAAPAAPVVVTQTCVREQAVKHGDLGSLLKTLQQAFLVGTAQAQDVGKDPVPPKKGPVLVKSDVHMQTMNGLRYDFMAIGEFIGLKTDTLELQARLQPFGTSRSVSVITGLAMNVADDVVAIYGGDSNPVRINHRPVALGADPVRLPHGGTVKREGNTIVVDWPGRSEVRVAYGPYLDYMVALCEGDSAHIQGLMGDTDTNPLPAALVARDGTTVSFTGLTPDAYYQALYRRVGDSWRINQRESLFDYLPGQSTKTFSDLKFPYQPDPMSGGTDAQKHDAESACRRAGIADPAALVDCILDIVATGDFAFAENDALTEAMFLKTRLAQRGSGSWECSGRGGEPGWSCTMHHLVGATVGSTMTFDLETLHNGQVKVESLKCGPVTEGFDAVCADKTQGINFQGAKAVERLDMKSGERWEIRSGATCEPAKAAGEPC